MPLTTDSLLDALRWRYATKRFDPERAIPQATWEALEESLVLTPSSFGLQPWKFLIIRDPDLRSQLQAESWNQSQVTDASHFIVLTTRTDLTVEDIDTWIACLANQQGAALENVAPLKSVIEGFVQAMTPETRHAWNVRQCYIALGQLMASAAVLGIDTCPMEGISATGYDRILELEKTGYATAVACALGYRHADDKYANLPKARFGKNRMIEHR